MGTKKEKCGDPGVLKLMELTLKAFDKISVGESMVRKVRRNREL